MQIVPRLIQQFVPEHYNLSLDLARTERRFSGTITISGMSPTSTGSIILHAKQLSIQSATVDGKRADIALGDNDELTIIHPDIVAGKHIVVIGYSGTIDDSMHGIYPCYFEHDGIKKEMLATQFESHHAREAFPCIDEPEAKATFAVTITTEQNVSVLGNMPVKAQQVEHDRLVTSFDTTPRMSTYLVAWVAGELHHKSASTKDGVEVTVWASPAQPASSLDFALTTSVELIEFFNDYFGIAYPLPKCDHVALPDFSVGAMENWGLITYREMALLADPATISVTSKRYIAMVIAHELSHQWFGNLVTMKWWNNLWLNESFANLMGYLAPATLHPNWGMWLDFISDESTAALQRDSVDGVQPVQIEIHHPDEIGALFDSAIMYAKGSRLINMLREYIGPEAFQRGLKTYFNSHAYTNTDENDLWRAFSDASGKDISHFMSIWISQPGYPVVTVAKNDTSITLSQQRFFIGPHASAVSTWPIPLGSSSSLLPNVLDTPETAVYGSLSDLELNSGNTSHFITHYDLPLLEHLTQKITTKQLAPADRLKILFEQVLLARGNYTSASSLVPLLTRYAQEDSEHVWNIIALGINELKRFVENDEEAEQKLRQLSSMLASAEYERLGWRPIPNEPETDTSLRATIVGLMLYSRDAEALETARALFTSTPIEKLDSELRSLIIGVAVMNDHSTATAMLAHYTKTSSAEIRSDIARGLTKTHHHATITYLLDSITNSDIVRKQDATHWFAWLISNPKSRSAAWRWLQDNWSWVETSFKSDLTYDAFPHYAASSLATSAQQKEYSAFFTPLKTQPALRRAVDMGIVEIEGRLERLARDTENVKEALLKL